MEEHGYFLIDSGSKHSGCPTIMSGIGVELLEYKRGLFWGRHLHPLVQNNILIYME